MSSSVHMMFVCKHRFEGGDHTLRNNEKKVQGVQCDQKACSNTVVSTPIISLCLNAFFFHKTQHSVRPDSTKSGEFHF